MADDAVSLFNKPLPARPCKPQAAAGGSQRRSWRRRLKSDASGTSQANRTGLKWGKRHASRSLEDLLSLDEKEEEEVKGPVSRGPSELLLSLPDLRANVSWAADETLTGWLVS